LAVQWQRCLEVKFIDDNMWLIQQLSRSPMRRKPRHVRNQIKKKHFVAYILHL
jgi:hypothetical protein